jgi:hypothetical protein
MPTQRWTFVVASLLLPVWLTVGRMALGSVGWMGIILVLYSPIVLLLTLVPTLPFLLRRDVRLSRRVPREEAVRLWVMFAAFYLAGFFLVDAGDASPSMGSVFTVWLGKRFEPASQVAFMVLTGLGLVLVVWNFVVGGARWVRARRQIGAEAQS